MIINNTFIYVKQYHAVNNVKDTTIIITHGLAAYSKSFIDTAEYLQSNGFNVIIYDLRGHGRSLGKRGSIDSYKSYIKDLHELVLHAKKETSNIYLIGHSLGGVITNLYVTKYNNVDGAIVAASPTDFLPMTNKLRYIPSFLINSKKLSTNFHDTKLVTDGSYTKDSYDLDYVTVKITTEVLIKGIKKLKKNFSKYTTPVLFLYSEQDLLVPKSNGEYIMENIASKDKKLIVYKNSKHNIFSDIEQVTAWDDIIKWIDERL